MLELIQYLQNSGFKVYIVTGAGQEFVRAYSGQIYNVEPENVIGTSFKTKYTYENGKSILEKLLIFQKISTYGGKPEAIQSVIGKMPILAIGNSEDDRQMLEWTQSNPYPHFIALVHHDDAQREFVYGADTKVGTFSDSLMSQTKEQSWNIISMKNDWKEIFPPAMMTTAS